MSIKKNYTAEEKAKIALESLKENVTFLMKFLLIPFP